MKSIILFLLVFNQCLFSQSNTLRLYEKGDAIQTYVEGNFRNLVNLEKLDSNSDKYRIVKSIESSLLNEAKNYYDQILNSKDNFDVYDLTLFSIARIYETKGFNDSALQTYLNITKSKGYHLQTFGQNNELKLPVDLKHPTYKRIVNLLIKDSNYNLALVYLDSLEKHPPSFGMGFGGHQKIVEWHQYLSYQKGTCYFQLNNYDKSLSYTMPYILDTSFDVSRKLFLLSMFSIKKVYPNLDFDKEFKRSIYNIYKERISDKSSRLYFTLLRSRIYLTNEQHNCIYCRQNIPDSCLKIPQY